MSAIRAERRLILLSAGTAARRLAAGEQAGRLLAQVDWSRLAGVLRARKLLPALGPRILEWTAGVGEGGFAQEVEQALEAGRRQSAFLALVALRVIAMLAEAGIPCATLKGPLLGEAIYGDPGRRLSSDVDLLVSPEHLRAAVDVVRTLGYAAPADYVQENGLPLLHFVLAHERGDLPPVELHWRIHWYEQGFARERLLPPTASAAGDWRADLAAELSSLLLFYARDGFIDLRLAADLSAWWDVHGAELERGALERTIRDYPSLARVIVAASGAAERIVGIPAARLLAAGRKRGVRERVAVRLANPNPYTSQSQLYADMGLIDGLLSPPGGFPAFARRQLLPPREVLDAQARQADRRRARSSLVRCVGVLARYGLAMARLVRTPETLG